MVFTVNTLDFAEISGFDVVNPEDALSLIRKGQVDLVVTNGYMKNLDYNIRRTTVDLNIPIILNGRLAKEVSHAMSLNEMTFYEIRRYGGGI